MSKKRVQHNAAHVLNAVVQTEATIKQENSKSELLTIRNFKNKNDHVYGD